MAISLTIDAIVLHRFLETFLRDLVSDKRVYRFFLKIEEVFHIINIP